MELSFTRVRNYHQAMQLLYVRNDCREGMTHNTALITKEEQERFWFKHLDPHFGDQQYEAYLLYDASDPIGYGLLKVDQNIYWMTAGLISKVRGKKLSRLIINFITEMGHRDGREVFIDVHDDNPALYGDIRVGYQFLKSTKQEDGKVLHVMRHERERILRQTEAKWMIDHGRTNVPWAPMVAPIPFSISKEMVEVDDISRKSYDPGAADPSLMMRIERGILG